MGTGYDSQASDITRIGTARSGEVTSGDFAHAHPRDGEQDRTGTDGTPRSLSSHDVLASELFSTTRLDAPRRTEDVACAGSRVSTC
jgi:hypothetical protein